MSQKSRLAAILNEALRARLSRRTVLGAASTLGLGLPGIAASAAPSRDDPHGPRDSAARSAGAKRERHSSPRDQPVEPGNGPTPFLVVPAFAADLGARPLGTDQAAHGTGLEIVDTDGQPVATPVVGRAYTLRATIVNPGAAAAYLGTADFYVAQAAEFDALAATPGATRPALSYAGFVALPGTTVRVDCPTLWTPRTTVEATSSVLVHAYDPIFDPLTKPFDAFTDRHVGRRDPNRETFVSEPGDQAISSSSVIGPAALAYGHSGCPAVDAQGFCVGGLWAIIPGAHWIWVTQIETNLAGASASFSKNFWLPENAKDITGSIQVAADDAYVVSLGAPPNAVVVGSDGTMDVNTVETPPYAWQNPKTFSIKPGILVPGDNSLEVQAIAYRERNYPTVNPAGIIYRMDLTWS